MKTSNGVNIVDLTLLSVLLFHYFPLHISPSLFNVGLLTVYVCFSNKNASVLFFTSSGKVRTKL